MDLFLAICQGAGLALAAGIGGYAALLAAAVLAHVHAGIDLRGTDFEWFASSWFIPVLFAAAIVTAVAGRPLGASPRPSAGARPALSELLPAAPLAVLGGVAFAASLAEADHVWWPGAIAGTALAAWAVATMAPLYGAAALREGAGRGSVAAMAAALGATIAAACVLAPPLAVLALAAVGVVWRGRRRRTRSKHAGLRSLR